MSDNLNLWNSVKETLPGTSQPGTKGRYNFTTIDPHSQLLRATEKWGPYGDKWGIEHMVWTSIEWAQTLLLQGHFFYPNEQGEKVSFPYAIDDQLKPGWEKSKMMITSFRSKCLSQLGFNADIYLGKHEDYEYQRTMEIKYGGDQQTFFADKMEQIKGFTTLKNVAKFREMVQSLAVNDAVPDIMIQNLHDALDEKTKELDTGS